MVQITRLHKHKENAHHDGGAACMLLVVTLYGERTLDFFGDDSKHSVDNVPGFVYLTSLCGTEHQVTYSGKGAVAGRQLPDLGEVGISVAFRTALFKSSPYTVSRPGPIPVWQEFEEALAALHKAYTFVLPSLSDYREAYNRLAQ